MSCRAAAAQRSGWRPTSCAPCCRAFGARLAFAALIYVVCLSGTLAVFLHEFQRWEAPDAPVLERAPAPEAIAAAVAAPVCAGLADNAAHDMFLFGPAPMSPRFLVNITTTKKASTAIGWPMPRAGSSHPQAPWAEFLAALHMHLHLPARGGCFWSA